MVYSIRSLKSIISQKSSRKINFSYVHRNVWNNFWGQFALYQLYFEKQKIIIRIIMNAGCRDSCCPLFRKLIILPLYTQNTLSLSPFVVKNIDAFTSNSAIHSINTRQGFDLHPPTTNLTKALKKLKFSIICH